MPILGSWTMYLQKLDSTTMSIKMGTNKITTQRKKIEQKHRNCAYEK